MRHAFISDIHSNIEALEAVLEDIDKQSADTIVCLGDIVGYGPNPNECTEAIRRRSTTTLLGNHDAAAVGLIDTQLFNSHAKAAIEWTSRHLTKANKTVLGSLPLTGSGDLFTLVHATPYEPGMWYYITSLEEAAFNFQHFPTAACLVGHTHIPLIVVLDGKHSLYAHQSDHINLHKAGSRFLINVGSVGQPRDRNPNACYALYDDDSGEFRFRRVPYDIRKTQERMRKAGLPEFLVTRLAEGR